MGTTTLNERSSRSHAVITLNVHSTPKGSTVLRTGKLNLVDLAGSEALTTDTQSVQTVETRAINKSLTSLCDVLQALSKNSRRPHGAPVQPVPYRNHKLTRLLADSLGGNSHTLMIAAVQRSHTHFRSTLTTLKYASRARDITQHAASVNEVASGTAADAADAAALRAKVAQLEARLSRREEEIERLESLQSARDKMATREHERQLAEQRASLAEEQGALQLALNELKAQASADAALSEREAALRSCEHEYEISGLEIRMLERMMDNRAQLLEAHLSQHELNAVLTRARRPPRRRAPRRPPSATRRWSRVASTARRSRRRRRRGERIVLSSTRRAQGLRQRRRRRLRWRQSALCSSCSTRRTMPTPTMPARSRRQTTRPSSSGSRPNFARGSSVCRFPRAPMSRRLGPQARAVVPRPHAPQG